MALIGIMFMGDNVTPKGVVFIALSLTGGTVYALAGESSPRPPPAQLHNAALAGAPLLPPNGSSPRLKPLDASTTLGAEMTAIGGGPAAIHVVRDIEDEKAGDKVEEDEEQEEEEEEDGGPPRFGLRSTKIIGGARVV